MNGRSFFFHRSISWTGRTCENEASAQHKTAVVFELLKKDKTNNNQKKTPKKFFGRSRLCVQDFDEIERLLRTSVQGTTSVPFMLSFACSWWYPKSFFFFLNLNEKT